MLPRQTFQLFFISEVITDVRYVPGVENIVANVLFRIDTIVMLTFDMQKIAKAQASDNELQQLK